MRNQWLRLLLLHRHAPSQPCISQVQHLHSFTSSLLLPRAPHVSPKPFAVPRRFMSSPEPAVEPANPPFDQVALLANIFANPERSNDEIKLTLDHKSILITHDLILSTLRNTCTDPDVAKRVFDWVSEDQSEKLSSVSYNLMLGILGGNGFVKETWDMIETMREKGYDISEEAFVKISERFQNDGLNDDVERLKELYDSDPVSCIQNDAGGENVKLYTSDSSSSSENDESRENVLEEDSCRVSDIIKREVWGDDLEKQLQELDVEFSSDLITSVLNNLKMDPNKALSFFRWVQESGLFKNDQQSFNVMARVLGEGDGGEKFWAIANEMRSEGHEMEREIYDRILKQFVKKNMLKDAVDLYEFATSGGIALDLSGGGKTELALEFMDAMVPSSYALHALISSYCRRHEPVDGHKILLEAVKDKDLCPWYTTYKTLTKGLLAQNHFKEALDVMSMIKTQGHPPYLDPFVEYLSKTGSAEDAIEFTGAVTSKRYPANNVFFRLFEAYLRAGRLSEAQDFLSKCPKHIKNHADILNMLSSGEFRTEDVAV